MNTNYIASQIKCGKCKCEYYSHMNGCPQCGFGRKDIVTTGTANIMYRIISPNEQ